MKIGIPAYEITYLGPPLDLEESIDFNGDHMNELVTSICDNINFNKSKGFDVTVIDLTSFEFLGELFSSKVPEISGELKNLIESTHVENHRIFFYIPKDYFLGSSVDSVINTSKICFDFLSRLLDMYGCMSGIIVRIGSAYGNRKKTIARFHENFLLLDVGTREKIMVTNDDRPSLFSVKDLLSELSLNYGIPIVFRTLAHYFNPGLLSHGDALSLSLSTWKEKSTPLIIHSESQDLNFEGSPDTRKVSDFIKYRVPTFNKDLCVILESNYREYSCYKYAIEYNSLRPVVIGRKKK